MGSDAATDDVNEFEGSVLEVQIAPKDDRFYKQNRRAVGKRVKVIGKLFHQHTGWHVTKIVLQATALDFQNR